MSRILVIDDQLSARSFIRDLLEGAGHTVVEAENGRRAVEVLTSAFDLVITDVLMPDVDGLEVVRHLKQVNPGIPVLVVSAGWKDRAIDLLSMAKKLGADRTLSKWEVRAALLPTVADMLSARR
jgi:CheY-like chemotaxis protein